MDREQEELQIKVTNDSLKRLREELEKKDKMVKFLQENTTMQDEIISDIKQKYQSELDKNRNLTEEKHEFSIRLSNSFILKKFYKIFSEEEILKNDKIQEKNKFFQQKIRDLESKTLKIEDENFRLIKQKEIFIYTAEDFLNLQKEL